MEKVEYSYENNTELQGLLHCLLKFVGEKNVHHCEIFASAYNPEEQLILSDVGFRTGGYATAWNNISETEREDRVVVALIKEEPNLEDMNLVPEFAYLNTAVFEIQPIKQETEIAIDMVNLAHANAK